MKPSWQLCQPPIVKQKYSQIKFKSLLKTTIVCFTYFLYRSWFEDVSVNSLALLVQSSGVDFHHCQVNEQGVESNIAKMYIKHLYKGEMETTVPYSILYSLLDMTDLIFYIEYF